MLSDSISEASSCLSDVNPVAGTTFDNVYHSWGTYHHQFQVHLYKLQRGIRYQICISWRCEIKPPIVNQQCLVYEFKCNLCDAGYVGYTRGHLHERVEGHTRKSSSINKQYNLQAPVVQRLDNAIHWINRYPADKC